MFVFQKYYSTFCYLLDVNNKTTLIKHFFIGVLSKSFILYEVIFMNKSTEKCVNLLCFEVKSEIKTENPEQLIPCFIHTEQKAGYNVEKKADNLLCITRVLVFPEGKEDVELARKKECEFIKRKMHHDKLVGEVVNIDITLIKTIPFLEQNLYHRSPVYFEYYFGDDYDE